MTELLLTLTEEQTRVLYANVANDLDQHRSAVAAWIDAHPGSTPPEAFAMHEDALSAVNKQLREHLKK